LFGLALDSSGGGIPNPNSNVPEQVGNADKGSFDPAKGIIDIRVATIKLDGLKPGKPMNGLNGRTFYGDDVTGAPHNQAIASDITSDGSYVVAGNATCIGNHAPIAALSANPTKGHPPLEVAFDASKSSDPDTGDSIASYTFNFGDGSDERTQNVPTITHVYTHGGAFFATCQVKDSKGLVSSNIASVTVKTTATLLNLSTREDVQTGDNVAIGGFIVTGNSLKKVMFRGIGPSLQDKGQPLAGRLEDPTLELHNKGGAMLAFNDNWKDSQKSDIEASGIAPTNDKESAIIKTLSPGEYTVILRGKNNGTGIGLVEIYDLDVSVTSQVANLSTRGVVATGDNVMIGGFIAGAANALPAKVVLRAIGPSMQDKVANTLADPTLELRDVNGNTIASNDNWKDSQQADIQATGLAPKDDAESAMLVKALEPGAYTAIVRGKNSTTGVALVEIYNIQK